MGTNYYAQVNTCKECNKPEYELHIGKLSWGWSFGFRGYTKHQVTENVELNLDTWEKWKAFLSEGNVKIVDEYGEEETFESFCKLVEDRQKQFKFNHAYVVNHPEEYPDLQMNDLDQEYKSKNWVDDKGYGFTDWEFC